MAERKLWDRLDEEPATWFARFLCYLNLGPTRTVAEAHRLWTGTVRRGSRKCREPGSWQRASRAFRWKERALSFDLHNLETAGQEALVRFNELIARTTGKLLASMDGLAAPTSWKEFCEVLHGLSPYISPDLLKRFQLRQTPEPTAPGGAAPAAPGA
jgi:hypothetical protein